MLPDAPEIKDNKSPFFEKAPPTPVRLKNKKNNLNSKLHPEEESKKKLKNDSHVMQPHPNNLPSKQKNHQKVPSKVKTDYDADHGSILQ